ncbi:MAG: heavy-metal-associated domain-containing protein [Anaerolineae bacterium]|nr:heavy-metal-associated domain-containing protein [Anaerolineae bacterium]
MPEKQQFKVEGMHCSGCVMAVEAALEDLPGVKSAKANYVRAVAEVEYDAGQVSQQQMAEALQEIGYTLVVSLQ